MATHASPAQKRFAAIVGISALALIVGLGLASYAQVFTDATVVYLDAGRSGLLLDRGADVRINGVSVGQVRGVHQYGHGARIDLALRPSVARTLPADVTADIDGTSIFGPKRVDLRVADSTGPRLAAGDVIRARHVTTEVDTLLGELDSTLEVLQPQQLNGILTQSAEALRGRGATIGGLIQQADGYLAALTPHLPAVRSDLASAAEVLSTYRRAAPDLLRVLRNTTYTSSTLAQREGALHSALVDWAGTSDRARGLTAMLEYPLELAITTLRPVGSLLAEYSPELTCLVKGLNKAREGAVITSSNVPAIQMRVKLLPSQRPYRYPQDLPIRVKGLGPSCYELPYGHGTESHPSPRYAFDDGSHAYGDRSDTPTPGSPPVSLYQALFGPAARAVSPGLGR